MINICFNDHSANVAPLSAQRLIVGLLERGAKFFEIEPESIGLRLDVDEEIVISGDWPEMGTLWQFCQAAIDGLLQYDWRDPDASIEAHLRQKGMLEGLTAELYA